MPKKSAVQHSYDQKKDRFDIRMKHFSLEKKWKRSELLSNLLATIDKKSPKRGKSIKSPYKETRLEEVGD
jgi:hypothetical protein